MFSLRWLKRIIRRNMNPIHELDAIKWKQRLAILYAFCAWNALGVVIYRTFNKKNDWSAYYGLKLEEEIEKRPGIHYAEITGKQKATIMRIEGLTITDRVEYEAPEEKDP